MNPSGMPRRQRHAQFVALSAELGLLDAELSRLLGFQKSAWSMYRSDTRSVPKYVVRALGVAVALKRSAPRAFNRWLNETREAR